jgi:hypothetical protein
MAELNATQLNYTYSIHHFGEFWYGQGGGVYKSFLRFSQYRAKVKRWQILE